MTRINCVPVEELSDKHLLAEYRELPRVFKLARKVNNAPAHYTLGKGHVLFFYDKLGYCYGRQHLLVTELIKRGFNPKFDPISLFNEYHHIKSDLWGFYQPTKEAIAINRARIVARTMEAQQRKYFKVAAVLGDAV